MTESQTNSGGLRAGGHGDPQNARPAGPEQPVAGREQPGVGTAEPPGGGEAPEQATMPMTATEETATAEKAVAEMRDRWQRAEAELDNTRKRYDRQLADQWRAERARVAAEWLPVLDNLERALGHAGADPRAIVDGIAAVRDQALSVLERLGFTRLGEVGEPFDPSRHEAAQVVDAPGAEPGTVVAVLRPGYEAADGLLRPAVVAVAGKRD
jgi:molecular chaperone GrpE